MRRDNQRRMQQEQLRNDGATPLTITLATFIVDANSNEQFQLLKLLRLLIISVIKP
jgi:hypothetical protein